MSSLLERIEAHFKPDERRRIEVPEWGEDGKPLVITYLPVTLDDHSMVSEASKGDRHLIAAHMVALKSCDEAGNRLFKQIDAVQMRTKASPEIVARISTMMIGGLTMEQAEKN